MQLLTPKEVAARLSVSPRTVYSWIAEGRLAAVHLSERVTRVPEDAVTALVTAATMPAVASQIGAGFVAEEPAGYGSTATLVEQAGRDEPESESERLRALLAAHREEIVRIVERSKGTNVRVFGSVVRGDATESSDLDLLVDARPGMSLFDLSEIESRLEEVLGRKVDVAVARSLRAEIRERVLAEARTL